MKKTSRRDLLATAAGTAVAAAITDASPATAQAGPKPIFPVAATTIPVVGEPRSSRSAGSTASAATTPPMPARWARTRTASRRSSSRNRRTPSRVARQVADHPYPSLTKNYHYEVELVAALKSGGRNIPAPRRSITSLATRLGLDMTRRDLQRGMGDEKKPWEIGKSFDHSAP